MRLSFLTAVMLCSAACNADQGPVEIIDERANELLNPVAKITVLGTGYAWTEGPLWIEDGNYLLFSDIPNNVIHKYVPDEGISVYLEKSGATGIIEGDSDGGSNGLLLNNKGELVLFQQGDRRVAVMDSRLSSPAGKFRTLAGEFEGQRLNSPNDGVFHSDGSLFFTDPPYGLPRVFDDPGRELPFQGVYRLSSDSELQLIDDSVVAPNGIGLSINEQTLYVAVSDDKNPHWLAYDVADDGIVSNKRVFHDAGVIEGEKGLPDGMAVHSSGVIFATGPGGVWLFAPEGKVLARIRTGRATANCTLSSDERTLYMTAHDTLMSIALKEY